ncbi:hypothetical protein ACJ41P_10260 [Azospirillum argentinense]|uniref:Uncharacterized protein n=1 Tax=Azospirillum argentinense TaxID=2970906 RepID=A0ABW8V546_9PROT
MTTSPTPAPLSAHTCIISVGQSGDRTIVWWGDDPVIQKEVDGVSAFLEDLGLRIGATNDPGLYRWTGTIELDGPSSDPESEPVWRGKLEPITSFPALDTLTARVAELEAERDVCAKVARHQADLKWEARSRATQAEAERDAAQSALAGLLRLTGTDTPAAAVSVVATMIAGADASAYGGVVRAYGDAKAALAAAEAREAALREACTELANAIDPLTPSPVALIHASEEWKRVYRALLSSRAALSAGAQQAQGGDIARELAEAVDGLLKCPEIADAAPEDVDEETRVAERKARQALAKARASGLLPKREEGNG